MTEPEVTTRRGLHVRPIAELVTDWCVSEDHRLCAEMWVAARWPEPYRGHNIDPPEK